MFNFGAFLITSVLLASSAYGSTPGQKSQGLGSPVFSVKGPDGIADCDIVEGCEENEMFEPKRDVHGNLNPEGRMGLLQCISPSTVPSSSHHVSSCVSSPPTSSTCASPSRSTSPFSVPKSSPPASAFTSSAMTPSAPSSPSASSSCTSGCRCEDPGELLGNASFSETELEKFGSGAESIWLVADSRHIKDCGYWCHLAEHAVCLLSPVSWPTFFTHARQSPSSFGQDSGRSLYNGVELTLDLKKTREGRFGGEVRTKTYYGYGCLSACMKPSSVSGVISSLFAYTGRYDGINGNNPHQNEVDIEFEGHDTTRVQLDYHTDRAPGDKHQAHNIRIRLGFDASASYNVYGFRWTPWGIEWEINGDIVRNVENEGGLETPVVTADTVLKVMANIWEVSPELGKVFGGPFDAANFSQTASSYKWIRYEKLDSKGCCTISATC